MKAKKKQVVEPRAKRSYGPFSEPRTIPGGLDVSEIHIAEQTHSIEAAKDLAEIIQFIESINEDSEISI
jgi:hypothetical protein